MQRNATIVIQGDLILRVEFGSSLPATYDLSGLAVLPGLIDTHVHLDTHFGRDGRVATRETLEEHSEHVAENARATLMSGFTTVQSLGAPSDRTLQEAVAAGKVIGPRLITSLGAFRRPTATPNQMRRYVRQQAAGGAQVIKVFASESSRDGGRQTLSDEAIRAACGEAREVGVPVWVHAHAASAVRAATLAGCTAVTHGTQVTEEELKLMAKHGTYFEPNIGLVIQNYVENRERFLGIGNFDEDGFRNMEMSQRLGLAAFRRAVQHPDLKILMGTDATAGAHGQNAREIVYRVKEGGQAPMDALRAATSLNAEALSLASEVGAIAPGMQADVIAVIGNPLTDIDALRRVVFVMRAGRVYKSAGKE